MNGLKDRVILLAGAAKGIGAAAAMRVAEEGARVVIADRDAAGAEDTAAKIRGNGGSVLALEFDQSSEESITRLVAKTVETHGELHGIVANVADLRDEVVGNDRNLSKMDPAVWAVTLQVNLIGTAVLIRECLPHLLAAGGGSIVCTSSAGAAIGNEPAPAYAASKSGVETLVRHVAARWGRKGVRANAIAPGVVLTETALEKQSKENLDRMLNATKSNRLGSPDDIGSTIAFLLSAESEWINGQVWSVDGGLVMRR